MKVREEKRKGGGEGKEEKKKRGEEGKSARERGGGREVEGERWRERGARRQKVSVMLLAMDTEILHRAAQRKEQETESKSSCFLVELVRYSGIATFINFHSITKYLRFFCWYIDRLL